MCSIYHSKAEGWPTLPVNVLLNGLDVCNIMYTMSPLQGWLADRLQGWSACDRGHLVSQCYLPVAIAVDVLLKMNSGWFQAYQSKSFFQEYYPESFILFILGVPRYHVIDDTIVSQWTNSYTTKSHHPCQIFYIKSISQYNYIIYLSYNTPSIPIYT